MFAGSLIANQLEGGRVRNRPISLLKKARLAVDCKFTADVYKVADKALDILKPTKRGVQNANFKIVESAADKLLWSEIQNLVLARPNAELESVLTPEQRKAAWPLLNNVVGNTQHMLMRACLEETIEELSPDSTFTPTLKELSFGWLGGPSVLGQVAYERYFCSPVSNPFAQLVGSCGWVYPHKDFAVLVDRPAIIDNNGAKLTFHDLYVYGR
jgi:hypothetical protein